LCRYDDSVITKIIPAELTLTVPVARRQWLALTLMFASGFASLGYQIVWTQQCAVWLGHETAAVLAVVAAFFGGLAVGSFALADVIARSPRPERWYAGCEALIALWSLVLAMLMTPIGSGLMQIIGAQPSPTWHWATAFVGTFLLLLPATAAMGATLPAMERVTAQMQRAGGTSIAALYACNTAGAVVGVLISAFWLIAAYGLTRTAGLCAAINLLCAAGALTLRSEPASCVSTLANPGEQRYRLLTLAATGFLGIGFEVVVVRVLSQVTEDTVYTFAMLLAVYLAGTAIGAAAYQRWWSAARDADTTRDRLLCGLAAACLFAAFGLWNADVIKTMVASSAGVGFGAALATEAALALAAFALPTIVMGALFSHQTTQARAAGIHVGQALAVNTAGAAVAPLVFGVLLIPAIGTKFALLMVATGYLALPLLRTWRKPMLWVPGLTTMALALLAPQLAFVDVPVGGRLVSYQEGAMSAVSVVEDDEGVLRLRIDNRQQEGSSNSLLADARQALLPLLLHPAPKRVLFLGLGTGVTARSAAEDPSLNVDAVELVPEVVIASDYFLPALHSTAPSSRLHVVAADARRYVRASREQYDVIISDNFHPARSGSGALYTIEHFRAVRQRLAADGMFCQWLPLHQLDIDTLRAVVQSFRTVYPDGWALLATNSLETPVIGLIGSNSARHFAPDQVRARIARATWPRSPSAFGLGDEFAVLGSFIAGPESLARFAGHAAANTDDRPVVAYGAPRITYAPDSRPRDRLVALLDELSIAPADLIESSADPAQQQRFAGYWAARTRFIAAGRDVIPTADVRQMLVQVQDPLLAVLRLSADFQPAYDPLLRMAGALAQQDPGAARALLVEMARLQPARPEASELLQQLPTARR
jgi:spermidine synthase